MEVWHFTKGKMGVGRGAEREAPYRQRKMHQSLQKRQVGKRCNQLSPLRFFPDMPFICVAQHCVRGGLYTLTNSGCYLKSIYSSRKLISHLISYRMRWGNWFLVSLRYVHAGRMAQPQPKLKWVLAWVPPHLLWAGWSPGLVLSLKSSSRHFQRNALQWKTRFHFSSSLAS